MADISYEEMIDEIIELIRQDDSANSATIEGMVERLRQLRALSEQQMLSTEIIAGEGLSGGGALNEDVTLSLTQRVLNAVESAESAVSSTALSAALDTFGKRFDDYVKAKDVEHVIAVPFTHAGAVHGSLESPSLGMPEGSVVTAVYVTLAEAGGQVRVRVNNDTTATATVAPGSTTGRAEGLSKSVSSLSVSIVGDLTGGITVNVIAKVKG